MSTFNEADHPRNHPTGAGRFSDKENSEPESNLSTDASSARVAVPDAESVAVNAYVTYVIAREAALVATIDADRAAVRVATAYATYTTTRAAADRVAVRAAAGAAARALH